MAGTTRNQIDQPAKEQGAWGEWIVRRWRFLGFKRIVDLSSTVGCSPDLLTRWHNSRFPPETIRKGFDVALIVALRTDRWTLFNAYASIAPEDAPVIDPPRDVDRVGGKLGIRRAPARGAA